MTSMFANKIQILAKGSVALNITTLLSVFAGTLVVSSAFGHIERYVSVFWRNKVQYKIREKIREKRHSLDAGRIKSEQFETLVRRIEESPFGWNIHTEITLAQFKFMAVLISLIASVWIVSSYSGKLALVLLGLSIPQFAADLHFGKLQWLFIGDRAVRSKRRNEASSCFTSITALLETKLFRSAPFLRDIIKQYESRFFTDLGSIERKRAWMGSVSDMFFIVGMIYCMYDITMAAQSGKILIGTMMLVMLSGFNGLRSYTRTLLNLISTQYEQSRYLADIQAFFELKPLLEAPKNPIPVDYSKGLLIEFKDVWFKYEGQEKFALRGLNLTIKPGEKIGIFGENGSGKSTLVSLLSRFYHPTSGSIYINGVDLKDIADDDWISCLSVLMQSQYDYDLTVREAIGIGNINIDPTDENLRRATRFANADLVIADLPQGFETQLGQSQGGQDLSGGQKKRFAIARRMFAEKPLCIMDEPENKLDADSKRALFAQLGELPRLTTAIYVSHSLETLGLAERILVFHRSELVEDGTSDQLLSNPKGLYRKAMADSWETMQARMEKLRAAAPDLFARA